MFLWVFRSSLGLGALAAAAAALLAQGGRVSPWLDVLTHFAPLYLLAGLAFAAVGAWLLRGRARGLTLACALATVASSLTLMAPEARLVLTAPETARADERSIRLVQINAWRNNGDFRRAIAWIARVDPDFVIIEEDEGLGTTLAALQGYHLSCAACGITILSREAPAWYRPERVRSESSPDFGMAVFHDPAGDIPIVGLHRHWPVRVGKVARQSADLAALLSGVPRTRMILAGDFNSTPWSFARKREDRSLGLVRRTLALPTWPARASRHFPLPVRMPFLPIDHVYAGPGWRTVSVQRGPDVGSDHFPVMVVLTPARR